MGFLKQTVGFQMLWETHFRFHGLGNRAHENPSWSELSALMTAPGCFAALKTLTAMHSGTAGLQNGG